MGRFDLVVRLLYIPLIEGEFLPVLELLYLILFLQGLLLVVCLTNHGLFLFVLGSGDDVIEGIKDHSCFTNIGRVVRPVIVIGVDALKRHQVID